MNSSYYGYTNFVHSVGHTNPVKIFSKGVVKINTGKILLNDGSIWGVGGTIFKEIKGGIATFNGGIYLSTNGNIFSKGAASGAFTQSTGDPYLSTLLLDFENYSIELVNGHGSDDNNKFRIENNQLIAQESFDFESQNIYNIRIRVSEPNGSSYEVAIQINIEDVFEGAGKAFKSAGTKYGDGWKYLDWFGFYFPRDDGRWNYHQGFGWIYIPKSQSERVLWFWHPSQGWLWTTSEIYPFLYSKRLISWMYFEPERLDRRLFQYSANQWIHER